MSFNRREFIATTLAGATTGAALEAHAEEGAKPPVAPAPAPGAPIIPTNVLGRTGVRIPRLLFGSAMQFNVGLLKSAYEHGLTYLDTADDYLGGGSETTIGKFIEATGLRKKLWITTKSCDHTPAGLERTLQTSLERLKTDYVDLLFIHNLENPKRLSAEMRATADRLKREGKIRFFGFSTHAPTVVQTLHHAAAIGWIDVVMFKYNFRAYGDQALHGAIDRAREANIGLIAMKTQGSAFSFLDKVEPFTGRGFNKFQAAIKAVWEDDRIDALVSEMGSVQIIEQNTTAAKDLTKLGARAIRELHRYADATEHLYCRGCEHRCTAGLDKPAAVADTLRFLMYHDEYGQRDRARELYRRLPDEAKDASAEDLVRIAAACPHGLDVPKLYGRASLVLKA